MMNRRDFMKLSVLGGAGFLGGCAFRGFGSGVYYEHFSGGDDLPEVVLSHGLGADSGEMVFYADKFRGAGHGVLLWDLPGHGRSIGTSASSVEDCVDVLSELIASENISRPILLGHSYGGIVSMAYASSNPFNCGGLVLMSTGRFLDSELSLRVIENATDSNKGLLLDFVENGVAFEGFEGPSILVQGRKDVLFGESAREDLANVLDSSKRFVLENAGHEAGCRDYYGEEIWKFINSHRDYLVGR